MKKKQPDKINELIINLDDNIMNDTLRYIFYKEINKVNNENYRVKIIEYLIKEEEIIKKSSNILQILLKQ